MLSFELVISRVDSGSLLSPAALTLLSWLAIISEMNFRIWPDMPPKEKPMKIPNVPPMALIKATLSYIRYSSLTLTRGGMANSSLKLNLFLKWGWVLTVLTRYWSLVQGFCSMPLSVWSWTCWKHFKSSLVWQSGKWLMILFRPSPKLTFFGLHGWLQFTSMWDAIFWNHNSLKGRSRHGLAFKKMYFWGRILRKTLFPICPLVSNPGR